MNQKNFVCGSCDFKTVMPEKLQSHYQGQHNLSYGDAWAITRSNIGELMTGQQFFDNFYSMVKQLKDSFRHGDGKTKFTIGYKGYLDLAKKAAGIE